MEHAVLKRVAAAGERSGMFERLASDWAILDAEVMPWSAKATELLQRQYAPAGAAALANTKEQLAAVEAAIGRGIEDLDIEAYRGRAQDAERFVAAYRRYCWNVETEADLKIAPFHVLASEGKVHDDQPHSWHMDEARMLGDEDPILHATTWRTVALDSASDVQAATEWWLSLVTEGGEGMVVKPSQFFARKGNRLIQPAVKCRGPEYLRIIYGMDYLRPHNLERLRERSLAPKRSLALREFALGLEGLHRFVAREPLRRVHQCAFAVLALESEPVDPRL